VTLWFDKVGLVTGTPNWGDAFREAIRGAGGVILIASPNTRQSDYVRDEVALAKNANKNFYPVWASGENWLDCVSLGIGGVQNADLRGDDYLTGNPRIRATK